MQRVQPADLRESRDVRVRRADSYPVLDRKRRQVSIRHQIASQVARDDEVTEDLRMPFARNRNPGRIGVEPVGYEGPGLARTERAGRRARVGRDALESQQRCPWQPDTGRLVERDLQPVLSGLVEWAAGV